MKAESFSRPYSLHWQMTHLLANMEESIVLNKLFLGQGGGLLER